MKNNEELRREVLDELEFDPSLDASRIAVVVSDGVVSLTGDVATFGEKYLAEKITKRIAGVTALVNDIEVKLLKEHVQDDVDIAKAAVTALEWNVMIPSNHIKVVVQNGHLFLDGEVNWQFQRTQAEKAVRYLPGVKAITNRIFIRPKIEPKEVRTKILDSFKRTMELEMSGIEVEVKGGEVILSGTVRSWAEMNAATRAAWSAPGVNKVTNNLNVNQYAYA